MGDYSTALLNANFNNVMIIGPDGHVRAANDAMCFRLGVSKDELIDSNVFDLFSEEDSRVRRSILERVVASAKGCLDHSVSRKGTVIETWLEPVLDESGRVESVVICSHDMPPHKELEDQRYRLATAIEQAAEAFVILDNDMNIEYVNQAFETMAGYTQSECRGKSIDILFKGQEQQCVLQNMIACLAHGDTWTGRTYNTAKDGRVFQSEETICCIRGKRYLPMGFVIVWRDVTETVELEKQLRHAQKMEAIGTLAGGIAHDFNNILGPIILHSELCLQKMAEDDENHESLEEILFAANKAKKLVGHILTLGRGRGNDNPTPFNVSSITKECLKILRVSINPDITVSFTNYTTSETIYANPMDVYQVIMNLCTNSVAAMEGLGGVLDISLHDHVVETTNQKFFPELNQGNYVQLTVRDTGRGISSEVLDKIFDPFFSTKSESIGAGLGLTMVHKIVTALSGAVRVDSALNEGTAFNVYLPKTVRFYRDRDELPFLAKEEETQPHVLLVDDDDLLVLGLVENLCQLGYRVTRYKNGYEALSVFRQDPEGYVMVMLDVDIPGMGGMDLASELRLSRRNLPVVILSGYTEVLPANKARSLGVWAFLRKPCHLEELEAVLDQVLTTSSSPGSGGGLKNERVGP